MLNRLIELMGYAFIFEMNFMRTTMVVVIRFIQRKIFGMMVHHVPRLNGDGKKKDHHQQESDMYTTFLHENEGNKNKLQLFDWFTLNVKISQIG